MKQHKLTRFHWRFYQKLLSRTLRDEPPGTQLQLCTQKRNQLLSQHGNGQTPCGQFTKRTDENANDNNLQSTRPFILQLYDLQIENQTIDYCMLQFTCCNFFSPISPIGKGLLYCVTYFYI